MQGYTVLEAAVRTALLVQFTGILTEGTCVIADDDALWTEVFRTNADYACLIDMGAPAVGRQQQRESFKSPAWTWRVMGVVAVRYDRSSIQARQRQVVDLLTGVFDSDHTLGGKAIKAEITQIDTPDVVSVNDTSWSFVGFSIDVWDR